MIAFPSMLTGPAVEAGIAVPEDPDDFFPDDYPRFHVFCSAQLGQPMPNPACHWDNAKVVARIPDDALMSITMPELLGMGFQVGFSK